MIYMRLVLFYCFELFTFVSKFEGGWGYGWGWDWWRVMTGEVDESGWRVRLMTGEGEGVMLKTYSKDMVRIIKIQYDAFLDSQPNW